MPNNCDDRQPPAHAIAVEDRIDQVLGFVEDWAGPFGRGVFVMDLDDSHHIAAARAALPKICSQLNNCDPR